MGEPYDGRTILELRIHGINNAPPEVTLGVPRDTLVRSDWAPNGGDDLGNFWMSRTPTPDVAEKAGDPELTKVRREAYSWGEMSRNGGGSLYFIGRFFIEVGWLLLLPFALCNLAYWTRRVPGPRVGEDTGKADAWDWDAGRGGPSVRLFALALTLLYVASFASVCLDLIGTQCITSTMVCAQLPHWFEWLSHFSWSQRMAILSLVPIVAIALLSAITARSRVRFEPNLAKLTITQRRAGVESATLRSSQFWTKARIGATTECLHFAGALALMGALLAWDHVLGPVRGCGVVGDFDVSSCLDPRRVFTSSGAVAGAVFFGICAVSLIVIIVFVAPVASERDARRTARLRYWAFALLGFAAAAYLATALLVFFDAPHALPGSAPVNAGVQLNPPLGLSVAPTIVASTLLAVALAGLSWRRGIAGWFSYPVLLGGLLCFLVFKIMGGGQLTDAGRFVHLDASAWGWASIALVVVHLVGVAVGPRWFVRKPKAGTQAPDRFAWSEMNSGAQRYAAWGGTGPGIVLFLAYGVGMAFSSMLVVGIARWLDGPNPKQFWRQLDGSNNASEGSVKLPAPFDAFSVAILLAVVCACLVAGAVALMSLRSDGDFSLPVLDGAGPGELYRPRTKAQPRPEGRSEASEAHDEFGDRIVQARRLASLVHRMEPLLAVFAAFFAIGTAVSLAVRLPDGAGTTWWLRSGHSLIVVSVLLMGALFLGGMGLVVAGLAKGPQRPLGVVWDLMCFLPRAGHPFGPQCYAERAVPEIVYRAQKWLDEAPENRVVLSAHSMGVVLAVSAVLSATLPGVLDPEGRSDEASGRRLQRLGLLSYGAQVRALFGRFFPDVFGPAQLGVRGILRPRLRGADPWLHEVDADRGDPRGAQGSGIPYRSYTVASVLTPGVSAGGELPSPETAWLNLWRRTDFLGFPVYSYQDAPRPGSSDAERRAANPIDRGAQERDPRLYQWNVANHSFYPDVPQYECAFLELIGRIERNATLDHSLAVPLSERTPPTG